MKHRSVVANFIFRWSADPNDKTPEVALFLRSTHPNIRSYQGKYAPISGSIEEQDAEPLLAARREIQEETQLVEPKDITLERCGSSFSFEDHDAQRSWTVYPFGWKLVSVDNAIKLDWEHSRWDWFDPKVILDGSMDDLCVPRIKDSLRRVYAGPDDIFGGGKGLNMPDDAAFEGSTQASN